MGMGLRLRRRPGCLDHFTAKDAKERQQQVKYSEWNVVGADDPSPIKSVVVATPADRQRPLLGNFRPTSDRQKPAIMYSAHLCIVRGSVVCLPPADKAADRVLPLHNFSALRISNDESLARKMHFRRAAPAWWLPSHWAADTKATREIPRVCPRRSPVMGERPQTYVERSVHYRGPVNRCVKRIRRLSLSARSSCA